MTGCLTVRKRKCGTRPGCIASVGFWKIFSWGQRSLGLDGLICKVFFLKGKAPSNNGAGGHRRTQLNLVFSLKMLFPCVLVLFPVAVIKMLWQRQLKGERGCSCPQFQVTGPPSHSGRSRGWLVTLYTQSRAQCREGLQA